MLSFKPHNAGMFSCVSLRLFGIVNHFNANHKLPDSIDSSALFRRFNSSYPDSTYEYFAPIDDSVTISYPTPISYSDATGELQFSDYKKIRFDSVGPFIRKYFAPSGRVKGLVAGLLAKYSIDPARTCFVYYRGTDKCAETVVGSFSEFIEQAREVQRRDPAVRFIIQTDEPAHRAEFLSQFPDSVHLAETDSSSPFVHTLYMLSAVLIAAQSKYIICSSSNVSTFMMLYRGHSTGVIQHLHPKEYIYGNKNSTYDPAQKVFWL